MGKFWFSFFAFLTVLVILLGIFRPDQLDNALNWIGLFMTVLLWTLFGAFLAVLIVGGGIFLFKIKHRSLRQVDGAYALQEIKLGHGRVAVIDPNTMSSFGYVVDRRTGEIIELQPAAGWTVQATVRAMVERTRQMQAIYPGDYTRTDKFGAFSKSPSVTAGAVKALQNDKVPKVIDAEPEGWNVAPAPTPKLLTGPVDAVATGDQSRWTVGQADNGELCRFDAEVHAHAAVVGNTGTGKTTSVATMLAVQAARAGYHVVILDPDGGADWSQFAGVGEHHETDRVSFPDQIRAVYGLFEKRKDGDNKRPVFVVLEEYGDLITQLRMVRRGDADHVDAMLDSILRRGRKRRIHLCFVDQYPDQWSPQVISGTKFRAVFQLGPNQGAKMQEYKAHELSDRGEFLWRGAVYRTWPAVADVPHLLTGVQPAKRKLITGGDTEPDAAPIASASYPAPDPEPQAKWKDFTDRWFEANVQYLAEPYGGISALARAMSQADGRPDEWAAYKSTAKEYFDAFTADWTAALNE